MATTINSGRGNSPKLTADVASRAEVYGGRGIVFDGIADYLSLGDHSIFNHSGNYSISVWIKKIGEPGGNRDTNDNPTIIAKGNVYFTLFVNGEGMLGTFFHNNSSANDYNVKTADGVIKLNVWHHIVLTWNNTSSQLYVDGKQEYSGSSTPYNLHTGVNGKEIRIGDRETPSTDTRWHGNMSDMKIFDSHLTEAQVQELYLKPENTPSAVQSNLKAWYPMCEGLAQSVAYDHSGNNNHAVEGGGSSYALAVAQNEPLIPQIPLMKYNQKMIFDGVDDYVQLPIPLGTTKHAISIWYYAKNIDEYFFDSRESSTHGIVLGTLANGTLWYAVRGTGATSASLVTTSGSFNKWNHVVATYNGSTAHVYINGVDVTPVNNSWSCTVATTLVNARLGSFSQSVGGLFDGGIDEASYFNTNFNQTEAQELYNSGIPLDATTHSKASALKGYWRNDGVTTWKNRADNYASFDGVDDVILRNAINVEYRTVSFWVRPNLTVTTDENYKAEWTVLNFNSNAFGAISLGERSGGLTNELLMILDSYGGWTRTAWENASAYSVPSDSWSHIGVSWDGSKYQMYFNGQPQTTTTTGTHAPLASNAQISLGRSGASGGEFYKGDLANFAMWSESLTDAQMLSIYNAGHNGDISSIQSSDLELYYTFNPHALTDADTNSTIQDRSGNNRDSTSVSGAIIDRDGTVTGTPDSITIREGLTSGKDGLGFPLKNPIGNVLRLNGVDEYVNLGTLNKNIWKKSFTLSFWMKPTDGQPSSGQIMMGVIDGTGLDSKVEALLKSDGAIRLKVQYEGTTKSGQSNSAVYADKESTWKYINMVQDADSESIILYVNDSVEASNGANLLSGVDIGSIEIDKDFFVGGRSVGGTSIESLYNGLLDEVRIYNRALSLAEIQKNYKHQKGKHKND